MIECTVCTLLSHQINCFLLKKLKEVNTYSVKCPITASFCKLMYFLIEIYVTFKTRKMKTKKNILAFARNKKKLKIFFFIQP